MTPAKRQNFERLLNPHHIAFVGGADAAVAIGEARRAGFSGQMWAVNPRRDTIGGLSCVASIADLLEPPDAVFLAIPAPAVPGAVQDLAALGAGGIVCYTAGFSEAHEEGRALEAELKAALGDMVLIGPNCYGLINYIGKSALWPFAHGGTCPGFGAAIITQSGMFSSDITMSQRSLPLAYMMSAGNQVDLGLTELVDLMCDRPEVRAIGIHIEGLSDVPAFERAALKALRAGKPIVALKTGSSAIGESLTISHTGSIAGANDLYQALFERLAIISVTNPSQFLETLKFLCIAGVPKGKDVLGFTCSGGGATMLADHSETIGLAFPTPDKEARAVLTGLLPRIATVSNPLDYTTPIWGQPDKTAPVFATAMTAIMSHTTLLVQDYPADGLDETEQLYLNDGMAFAEAASSAKLPAAICATIPENMGTHIREAYVARGVAPMQGIHETLNAVSQAAWHGQRRRGILAAEPASLLPAKTLINTELVDEAKAKQKLAAAGFPVPAGRASCGNGIREAGRDVGFPVVLKMMGPELIHKTEAGAVTLGIANEDSLARATSQMRNQVRAFSATAVTDDFLIEATAPQPLAEVVVGLRHDAQFGMAMTLGSGGILVELVGDTRSLLLPVQRKEIAEALRELRVSKLLNGFRGRPEADTGKLVDTLHALATFVMDHADEIAEVEINPLFVYADGVMVIDCLMQRWRK